MGDDFSSIINFHSDAINNNKNNTKIFKSFKSESDSSFENCKFDFIKNNNKLSTIKYIQNPIFELDKGEAGFDSIQNKVDKNVQIDIETFRKDFKSRDQESKIAYDANENMTTTKFKRRKTEEIVKIIYPIKSDLNYNKDNNDIEKINIDSLCNKKNNFFHHTANFFYKYKDKEKYYRQNSNKLIKSHEDHNLKLYLPKNPSHSECRFQDRATSSQAPYNKIITHSSRSFNKKLNSIDVDKYIQSRCLYYFESLVKNSENSEHYYNINSYNKNKDKLICNNTTNNNLNDNNNNNMVNIKASKVYSARNDKKRENPIIKKADGLDLDSSRNQKQKRIDKNKDKLENRKEPNLFKISNNKFSNLSTNGKSINENYYINTQISDKNNGKTDINRNNCVVKRPTTSLQYQVKNTILNFNNNLIEPSYKCNKNNDGYNLLLCDIFINNKIKYNNENHNNITSINFDKKRITDNYFTAINKNNLISKDKMNRKDHLEQSINCIPKNEDLAIKFEEDQEYNFKNANKNSNKHQANMIRKYSCVKKHSNGKLNAVNSKLHIEANIINENQKYLSKAYNKESDLDLANSKNLNLLLKPEMRAAENILYPQISKQNLIINNNNHSNTKNITSKLISDKNILLKKINFEKKKAKEFLNLPPNFLPVSCEAYKKIFNSQKLGHRFHDFKKNKEKEKIFTNDLYLNLNSKNKKKIQTRNNNNNIRESNDSVFIDRSLDNTQPIGVSPFKKVLEKKLKNVFILKQINTKHDK